MTELQRQLGAHKAEVNYLPVKKGKYVIEVADRLAMHIPRDFELVSQRKGFKRYVSPRLKTHVQTIQDAEDRCEQESSHVLHKLLGRFIEHHKLWMAAVKAIAQLDVLMSLSIAAVSLPKPSCRPKLMAPSESASPLFEATELRHPNLCVRGAFVPNDIHLGGRCANFMVLTGANMGGKSTLLRQVCLATLLAQVRLDSLYV